MYVFAVAERKMESEGIGKGTEKRQSAQKTNACFVKNVRVDESKRSCYYRFNVKRNKKMKIENKNRKK